MSEGKAFTNGEWNMKHIKMESCCTSCVAYETGCCALSDLPMMGEDCCSDYRPCVDMRFKHNMHYGR